MKDQMEDVGAGQRADLRLPALAVAVVEAYLAAAVLIAGEQVGLANHTVIEVTTEINEGLLAVAGSKGSFRKFVEGLDLAPLRFDWTSGHASFSRN